MNVTGGGQEELISPSSPLSRSHGGGKYILEGPPAPVLISTVAFMPAVSGTFGSINADQTDTGLQGHGARLTIAL